jgi:hypothetical protein
MGMQLCDVFEHLHRADAGPSARPLQHYADPGEQVPPITDWVETQDPDRPTLWSPVALAGLQGGGLACPVRTEDGGDRVPLDDQVERVDRDLVAVRHPEPAHLDGGSRRR